jgi:hypothetical protein
MRIAFAVLGHLLVLTLAEISLHKFQDDLPVPQKIRLEAEVQIKEALLFSSLEEPLAFILIVVF